MKSILLTTTAIVAFAGAAAADGHTSIDFTGDAALGYNDDVEDGFYWDANLDFTMTAALDNGITATATVGIQLLDDALGGGDTDTDDGDDTDIETGTFASEDFVLTIASESASMSFGDVDPVAEANYGGVDGDSTLGFNDQDAHLDTGPFDSMLTGEATLGGVTAMLSYGVFNDDADADALGLDVLDALQVYATGEFGMFSVEAAYQDELTNVAEYSVFAISGTAAVMGAELTAAYIMNTDDELTVGDEEESSFGLGVSYPVGPVTLGGYYSVNDVAEDAYGVSADYADGPIAVSAFYDFEGGASDSDDDNVTEYGVEGSYDVGNGFAVLAGYIETDDDSAGDTDPTAQTYVAGTYDLGGGAELLVSYAENEANDTDDEIGDPEYLHGTTVKVSFSF